MTALRSTRRSAKAEGDDASQSVVCGAGGDALYTIQAGLDGVGDAPLNLDFDPPTTTSSEASRPSILPGARAGLSCAGRPVLPSRLRRIIELFARLPGVGEKTAQRFAMHLVGPNDFARDLGRELLELAEHVRPCERCGNIAEIGEDGRAECPICRDSRRDARVLCIVARVQDLLAIERSGAMRGRYFVLGQVAFAARRDRARTSCRCRPSCGASRRTA